jgi:hypothetical protein
MPPLILYDDKMIQIKGGDGTSHTREPLGAMLIFGGGHYESN